MISKRKISTKSHSHRASTLTDSYFSKTYQPLRFSDDEIDTTSTGSNKRAQKINFPKTIHPFVVVGIPLNNQAYEPR